MESRSIILNSPVITIFFCKRHGTAALYADKHFEKIYILKILYENIQKYHSKLEVLKYL